jgi:hypothetical protein
LAEIRKNAWIKRRLKRWWHRQRQHHHLFDLRTRVRAGGEGRLQALDRIIDFVAPPGLVPGPVENDGRHDAWKCAVKDVGRKAVDWHRVDQAIEEEVVVTKIEEYIRLEQFVGRQDGQHDPGVHTSAACRCLDVFRSRCRPPRHDHEVQFGDIDTVGDDVRCQDVPALVIGRFSLDVVNCPEDRV